MGCGSSTQADVVDRLPETRRESTTQSAQTAGAKVDRGALLPYLAVPVVRRLKERRFLSQADRRAVFLFADISGFTALSERLSQAGAGGADRLSKLISQFLTMMLEIMAAHGGHVAAFDGDALLVLFDEAQTSEMQRAMLAVQCALALQRDCGQWAPTDDVTLRLHSAVSVGPVWHWALGDDDERLFLVYSPAVLDLAAAMDQSGVGETVLHGSLVDAVGRDVLETQEREHGCHLVTAVREPVPLPSSVPWKAADGAAAAWDEDMRTTAEAFAPPFIRDRIAAGQAKWMAENRRVSIVFMDLAHLLPHREPGSPPSDEAVQHAAETLQTHVVGLQTIIRRYGGHIRQLTMDDKGLVLIVLFGLPGMSHEDDPDRAVRTALDMHALLAAAGTRVTVGVTTGRVFCGNVGSEWRCEYAAVGDKVNLSARLMCFKDSPGVVVDDATVDLCRAGGRIHFTLLDDKVKVKGKSTTIAVFAPSYADVGDTTRADDAVSSAAQLIGRDQLLASTVNAIVASNRTAHIHFFTGRQGSGKSHFANAVIERAREEMDGPVPVRVIETHGSTMDATVPFLAVSSLVSGLLDRNTPVLEQISAALDADDGPTSTNAALLAPLLRFDATGLETSLDEKAQDEAVKAMMAHLLVSLPKGAPTLLVVENAHLLDQQSVNVLVAAADLMAARAARIIVLCTMVELESGVLHEDHAAVVARFPKNATSVSSLGPLARADVAKLAKRVLGATVIPEQVVEQIADASACLPLFVREVCLSAKSTGAIALDDAGVVSVLLENRAEVGIPRSQEAALTSRLDQLPLACQLMVKLASVFGDWFWDELLLHVVPDRNKEDAQRDLALLMQPGSIFAATGRQFLGRPQIAFVSAAVRDIAYSLLADANRRQVHLAAAKFAEDGALIEKFPDDALELKVFLMTHWASGVDETSPRRDLEQAMLRVADVAVESRDLTTGALWPLEQASRIAALYPCPALTRYRIADRLSCVLGATHGLSHPRSFELASKAYEISVNELDVGTLDKAVRKSIFFTSWFFGMQLINNNQMAEGKALIHALMAKFREPLEAAMCEFLRSIVVGHFGDMAQLIESGHAMLKLVGNVSQAELDDFGASPFGATPYTMLCVCICYAAHHGDVAMLEASLAHFADDRFRAGPIEIMVRPSFISVFCSLGAFEEAMNQAVLCEAALEKQSQPRSVRIVAIMSAVAKAHLGKISFAEGAAIVRSQTATFISYNWWHILLQFMLEAGDLDYVAAKVALWEEKIALEAGGIGRCGVHAIKAGLLLARLAKEGAVPSAEQRREAVALFCKSIDEAAALQQLCVELFACIELCKLVSAFDVANVKVEARARLDAALAKIPAKRPCGAFKLWIDRAASLKQ